MENKLKEYREKKGMTQEELAAASGISRTTISQVEGNAVTNLSLKTMQKLANALGYKVKTIFLL